MKILIQTKKDTLVFSKQRKFIPEENLNNTNIINAEKLVFEDGYIKTNNELICAFLKTIIIKKQINIVVIYDINLSEIVLSLIQNIPHIKKIYFVQDLSLDYKTFLLLMENKNIEYINCYTMPEFLFDRLNILKQINIELRMKNHYIDEFIKDNDLITYSKSYYKKKIDIKHDLDKQTLYSIDAFLQINNHLKVINLYEYSIDNIKKLVDLIIRKNKTKIRINVIQKGNEIKRINEIIDYVKKEYISYLKLKKIDIKVIYSNTYIKKNGVKQINIVFIKNCLIALIIFVLLIMVLLKFYEFKSNENLDEVKGEISDITDPFEQEDKKENITKSKEDFVQTETYYKKYDNTFKNLLSINADTIGWLKVPGTKIDYPIVQSTDNNYYLKHNFYKQNSILGWIFLDYRNDFNNLNDNSIIYGHDTSSGIMFGSLKNLLKTSNNNYITFNTVNKNMSWQIFSIYTIKVTNDYLITDFSSKKSYNNYIKREIDRSIINYEVNVSNNDKILTLSTCYGNSNKRLVVHAKLINK